MNTSRSKALAFASLESPCITNIITKMCFNPISFVSTYPATKATCSCSIGLHCSSFNNLKFDVGGSCEYTLARDGCVAGAISTTPSFEVTGDTYWETHTATYPRIRALKVKTSGLVRQKWRFKILIVITTCHIRNAF